MKLLKAVLVSVILPIFTVTFLPNTTQAMKEEVSLGTIIVSTKRVSTESNDSAENITVYSGKNVQESIARDLSEVLSDVPGVDVKVVNSFGHATSLTINGSDSRHVLVMVDGIPFNTQLSGQANPARIPLENIGRIEIIKGASSSVWGSSLGGVINVITKDVGTTNIPKGQFSSSYAEFGTIKESMELAGKVGEVGYFVSGSFMKTNGTRDISDVEEVKAFGKLATAITENLKLIASFGYSGADVLDGPRGTSSLKIYSTPYQTRYGKLALEGTFDDIKANFAYKYNDQEIVSDVFSYPARSYSSLFSTNSSNVYHGMSLNASKPFRDSDLLVLGVDLDWEIIKSSLYLPEAKSISKQAPFANYTWDAGQFDYILGMRYDNNQKFGSQYSPSFGIVYDFEDDRDTKARFKFSRAFNAPPLLWLYNENSVFLVGANPDLKAERAYVYELGFESKITPKLTGALNLHRSDVRDAIAVLWNGSLYRSENIKKFRRMTAELLLNYKICDVLSFEGSAQVNDPINKQSGDIVLDQGVARQAYKMKLKYEDEKGWYAMLSGTYNRWLQDDSATNKANDAKFILDARFAKEIQSIKNRIDLELFLNVHNLLNSKYWSSINFPHPERYFEGGFTVKF